VRIGVRKRGKKKGVKGVRKRAATKVD